MITINSQKNPSTIVIWLHGLGADENDFVPFIKSLGLDSIEFILPNAPLRPITMNQGILMRGWYDIKGTHESLDFSFQDDSGLINSKSLIETIIKKRLMKLKFIPKVFIGGFSQGAALSLFTSLTSEVKISGIISLSGYLPKVILKPKFKVPPIIAIHGVCDDIISNNIATESYKKLKKSTDFYFKSYNMTHEVIQDEIIDVKNFLKKYI